MAVSELEKNSDSIIRLTNIIKSSHRSASSNGGKTSYSYRVGHVEEVFLNWQVLMSNEEGNMVWMLLGTEQYLNNKLATPVRQCHGAEADKCPANGSVSSPALDVAAP